MHRWQIRYSHTQTLKRLLPVLLGRRLNIHVESIAIWSWILIGKNEAANNGQMVSTRSKKVLGGTAEVEKKTVGYRLCNKPILKHTQRYVPLMQIGWVHLHTTQRTSHELCERIQNCQLSNPSKALKLWDKPNDLAHSHGGRCVLVDTRAAISCKISLTHGQDEAKPVVWRLFGHLKKEPM